MADTSAKAGTNVGGGMPSATKKAMQQGRLIHNAALKKLTEGQRYSYKQCQSAISTIEMVQRRLLAGQPVQAEFLASIGTLQSYAAGMLS